MLTELETQMAAIRDTAAQRSATQRRRQDSVDAAVLNEKPVTMDANKAHGSRVTKGAGQRLPSKRDLDQQMEGELDDLSDEEGRMDLDEGIGDVGHGAGRGGHGAGSSRGAKRNRGRGSK